MGSVPCEGGAPCVGGVPCESGGDAGEDVTAAGAPDGGVGAVKYCDAAVGGADIRDV